MNETQLADDWLQQLATAVGDAQAEGLLTDASTVREGGSQ
jgi:hypothetical protein